MTETERRIEHIRELLTTYRDAVETLQAGHGGQSSSELNLPWHELRMPNVYGEGDYAKLEGYLCALRSLKPELYWHLSERYLRSVRSRRIMRKSGNHWLGLGGNEAVLASSQIVEGASRRFWVTLERWNRNVDPLLVEEGLQLLERVWKGPVRVPRALLEEAA